MVKSVFAKKNQLKWLNINRGREPARWCLRGRLIDFGLCLRLSSELEWELEVISSYSDMKGPDAEVTNPVVTRKHEESQKWLPTDLTDLSVCFLPPPHLAPGRHWMCVILCMYV